ncbi:MAG: zf-HC2 domain-containing protein, partial [Candidatus Tectomicrobia bacterium]|nr:zf-HC2 domain-containing protein [Candidatus Tectomicrobia bacterium]
LIDYVDGNLPAEDRARLDPHSKNCPNCLAMMKTYRQTIAVSREVSRCSMSAEIRLRLERFFQEKLRNARLLSEPVSNSLNLQGTFFILV